MYVTKTVDRTSVTSSRDDLDRRDCYKQPVNVEFRLDLDLHLDLGLDLA